MKNIRLNLIMFLLFWLCLAGVQAQEAIPAAGGAATGINGSASYTVGQVVFMTLKGMDGLASQGVQQSYENTVFTSSRNHSQIKFLSSVYPNPVIDQLRLSIESEDEILFSTLSYQLYDSEGRLLKKKRIYGTETIIQMDALKPAGYLLQVINNKSIVKEFTIIKNQ